MDTAEEAMNTLFHEIEQPEGAPLARPEDMAVVDAYRQRVYESYERFLRQRLAELDRDRARLWRRDYSSVEAYQRSVEPMRQRLAAMLGWWIEPQNRPPLTTKEEQTQILFRDKDFIAYRVSFEVLPGLESYAVELAPCSPGPHPGLLAQHGYSGCPELVCGLAAQANAKDYSYRSLGIRAARRGYHVVAVQHPSGYGTADETIGSLPRFQNYGRTYGKNRLHRLALMAGGTLFGLDMMASSRGVDLLMSRAGVDRGRIGMYGLSQGGMSALYLPALDKRIKASVCAAYFNSRLLKLIGPHRATCYLDSPEEDKFFADVVRCFADADLASLICPRSFAVEAGEHDTSVDFEKSRDEFPRAAEHYRKLGLEKRVEFIAHKQGHVSATARAFQFLQEQLAR
ncbi:MAG: acetylxylan esterase [Verrucomicrobia bacterium]|nr:acetylxylan esterase [Verrucomicrobiota bacterium]